MRVQDLKWPQNRLRLAFLSLEALQTWYAAQNPKDMIVIANTKEFKRFWHFVYILPTHFYRFLFKLKRFGHLEATEKVSA